MKNRIGCQRKICWQNILVSRQRHKRSHYPDDHIKWLMQNFALAIENSQHYVLDVCYGQDMLRAKNRNFIRNALLLNKIALNTAGIARRDSTDRQMSVTRIKKIMSFDLGLLCRSLCKGITADSGTDKAG